MWVCDAVIHLLSLHSCMRLSLWHCLSVAHSHWRAFCRERNVCGFQRWRYSDLCSLCTLSMQCHCVLYVQFVRTLPLSHPLSLSLFFCLSVAPSVSGDSGSLLMSEIVDIPDDSSPSEDSCVLEVAFAVRSRVRGVSEGGEGFDYNVPQPPAARCFFRGERSNSCSSPSTYNTSSFR